MRLSTRCTAILLSIIFLLSAIVPLCACASKNPSGDPSGDGGTTDNSGAQTPSGGIITPPYKEYSDRRTIDYKDMTYVRPDFDLAIAMFEETISKIETNGVSYEEQLASIHSLGEPYEMILSMYALIEAKSMHDRQDKSIAEEYSFVLTNYPRFASAIEALYVACACSSYARNFEEDYFRSDISEYADGGILTDEVVALLSREGELESTYSTLSSSATFEYNNEVGTYDYFLEKIQKKYATIPNSAQYYSEKVMLDMAYQTQITEPINNLYVELVRVRREIADALGDETYLTFAYEENGFEYTPSDMKALLQSIRSYAAPIYWDSSFYSAYDLKMQSLDHTRPTRQELINSLYTTYMLADAELSEVYAYMLQFGLYDIERESSERFEGAFTTYINQYDAPFLFATITQSNSDYLSLSHEFGHFMDLFVNGSSRTSLDLQEIFSQGLELLTTLQTKRVLPQDTTVFLKYQALYEVLQTLMIQGYYSEVELRIYSLPYEEITKESISTIAKEVAREYGFGNPDTNFDISTVIITHTVLRPTYVQSYCTSVLSALELYMLESEEDGAGLAVYKALLHTDPSLSYFEALREVGLTSPFESGIVRSPMNELYYEFLGRHFYSASFDNNVA